MIGDYINGAQAPGATTLDAERDDTFTRRLGISLRQVASNLDQVGGTLDQMIGRNFGPAPCSTSGGKGSPDKPMGRFAEIEQQMNLVLEMAESLVGRAMYLNATI